MKRTVCSVMILVLILAGCQDQHQRNKTAAMERWNAARSQITTNLAKEQFQSGDFAKAAQTAQSVVDNNPPYLPARILLGQIYLEQELYAKAKKCFTECLVQEPGNPQANYNLGLVHEKWNELDQAFTYYEQAWKGQPDHIPYLLAMVETKVSQGEYEGAIAILLEGMKETEQDPRLYMTAGTIYSHLGQYSQAIEMFEKVRDSRAENSGVTEALAFCLHKAGRDQEAVCLFQKLIAQNEKESQPTPWSCYLALGDCYMNLKQYHDAWRCYDRVSQQDGSNPKIWVRLAQATMERKEYDRAKGYLARALTLNPGDPEVLMAQGIIAMQEKEYGKAQDVFRAATRADDRNVLAYCWLGQSLQAQGNESEARTCYAQALEIDPQDQLARKFMLSIDGQSKSASPRAEKY
jgi:tetratricopeptide (TPR) repeat protein